MSIQASPCKHSEVLFLKQTMAQNEYSGSYTLELTEDDGSLTKLLDSQNKERIKGDDFNINQLPFCLELFANGDNDANIGSFMLYCTLLSMPDKYKQITLNLRLYSKETHSSFTSVAMFTSQRNSAGWNQDTLKLDEISDLKQLSIGCDINILQIIGIDNDIIYQYSNPSATKSVYNYTWNIDQDLMSKFKDCRIGRSFESEIYDKMWCLRCLPNGKRDADKGNVKLYLLLCSLPSIADSDSIHIQYTLWCNETNTGYNSAIVLNYEYSTVGWPNKILLLDNINEYSSLTLNAEIEIITNDQDNDDEDEDESTYSSSSLDYGVKGTIAEDEEKQIHPPQTAGNDEEINIDKSKPPQITPADVIVSDNDTKDYDDDDDDEEEPDIADKQPEIEPDITNEESIPIADKEDKPEEVEEEEKDEQKIDTEPMKKKRIHKRHKNKKKLTVDEFKSVSLEDLIENDVSRLDNYDIAKKICKFFDNQFEDRDTV